MKIIVCLVILSIFCCISLIDGAWEKGRPPRKFERKRKNAPGEGDPTTPKPYVYMHIPRTAGTMMREVLDNVMGVVDCNKMLNITVKDLYNPPLTMYRLMNKKITSDRRAFADGKCSLISYPFGRREMEPVMSAVGYRVGTYNVMSSFREPLSLFLSAYEEMSNSKMSLRETVDAYNGKSALYTAKDFKYNLVNFMTSFLLENPSKDAAKKTPFSIEKALSFVDSMYWFAVVEHLRLSLALLQCQVSGRVDTKMLDMYFDRDVLKPYFKAQFEKVFGRSAPPLKHYFDERVMSDISKLLKVDFFIYEHVVLEFWRRVGENKRCLGPEVAASIPREAHTSVAFGHFEPSF